MTRRAAMQRAIFFANSPLTFRLGGSIFTVPTVLIVLVHAYNHGGELMAFSFGFLIAAALLIIILFAAFLLRR